MPRFDIVAWRVVAYISAQGHGKREPVGKNLVPLPPRQCARERTWTSLALAGEAVQGCTRRQAFADTDTDTDT
ncbi:MAG: hypothetical protein R3E45_05005, partial [Rhodocyclaceae bacterium]